MKKLLLLTGAVLMFSISMAQRMELRELMDLLDVPSAKIDNVLSKKGFRRSGFLHSGEATLAFTRMSKDGADLQYFKLAADKKFVYETPSAEEFTALKAQIKSAGFFTPSADTTSQSLVYQKKVITIETATRTEEGTLYYVIRTSKKELPLKKAVLYAEDLLVLDSHEYLSEMFGREHVRVERFYFAADDSTKCSVIFPNSDREAVILWKDTVNLRQIDLIIIGGALRPGAAVSNAYSFNTWRSAQGPYCGMSLKELVLLNQGPLRFYNWHTESGGYLVPKNSGSIDFKKLGLVLSCMNCHFVKVSESEIIDSEAALAEQQKVFVTTLVIMPGRR